MAVQVEIPEVGESVSEVILVEWLKSDGDYVHKDDPICVLETDKADIELPAPATGALKRNSKEGDTILVGENIATIDETAEITSAKKSAKKVEEKKTVSDPEPPKAEVKAAPVAEKKAEPTPEPKPEPAKKPEANSDIGLSPAVRRLVEELGLDASQIPGTGKDGRLTKEDVMTYVKEGVSSKTSSDAVGSPAEKPVVEAKVPAAQKPAAKAESIDEHAIQFDEDGTKRVGMTKMRKKIAERLVKAQQSAAMLTTFNEIDMKALMDLRKKYREPFEAKHGVGLGMMSFFARACIYALDEFPRMNAFMDGEEIIYHKKRNLGVAVSTDRGLVVPVIQNAGKRSLAKIEQEIRRLAVAAREGKLGIKDLSGGTFSITNGGVFGSLLSTPILNMPQTGILGMHTIQERPVVIDKEIVIRPMMYVALTYDHRMIDGKEAVTFLVRIKQMIEDPARLLLEV